MSSGFDRPQDSPLSLSDVSTFPMVASFTDYRGAERAVDSLSDSGFPVENLKIVGHGLSTVEIIQGRLTLARASVMGAGTGAWFGLLIGLLIGMFIVGTTWLWVLLSGLLIGAAWGAVFGFAGHWAARGRRDFSSVSTLAAERYDVVCRPAFAEEAARLLGHSTQ